MSTILIVDDDSELRKLLRQMLVNELHVNIIEAECGIDAMNLISTKKIDLIISDIQMPNGNGLWLLGEMLMSRFQTPFIFFTATPSLAPTTTGGFFYGVIPKANWKKVIAESDRVLKLHGRF